MILLSLIANIVCWPIAFIMKYWWQILLFFIIAFVWGIIMNGSDNGNQKK